MENHRKIILPEHIANDRELSELMRSIKSTSMDEEEIRLQSMRQKLARAILSHLRDKAGEFIFTGDIDIDGKLKNVLEEIFFKMLTGGLSKVYIFLIGKDKIDYIPVSWNEYNSEDWEKIVAQNLQRNKYDKIVLAYTRGNKRNRVFLAEVDIIGRKWRASMYVPLKPVIRPAEGEYLILDEESLNNIVLEIHKTSTIHWWGRSENLLKYFLS